MAAYSAGSGTAPRPRPEGWGANIRKNVKRHYGIYLMVLPVVAYYLIFNYAPIAGAVIAFKDFSPKLGIFGSHWVGFKYFISFFKSIYFTRVVSNTLIISFFDILFGFPLPIILALLINEVGNKTFKRSIQTISYLPHFISVVVVCGLIQDFFSTDGVVNSLFAVINIKATQFLSDPSWFRPIFVGSNVWQSFGWNSIIYLAALTSINPQLYEAARIDGASRWRQTLHITLPGILPITMTLLILRIGNIMSVGFEKIILLYNPMTYETADVISTFVYRKGILEMNFSFSTAVGLFNAAINCLLLVTANRLSRKVNDTAIW
jgi:putative aldouronate transport system permease protein